MKGIVVLIFVKLPVPPLVHPFIRELSFLMLGTGVEEFLRQMGTFSYPIF